MAARAILPWFGGGAAVWTACLVFFQAGLLLGYLYAHALTRFLRPRAQALVHVALLAAALATLPAHPSAGWKPAAGDDPALRILALLAATFGLPYALLCSTSPLVQAWAARANPAGVPWRLFALSNASSLAALLTYPFLIEPFLGVSSQIRAWSVAFAAFAVVSAAVAWRSKNHEALPAEASGPAPGFVDRAMWVLLSACAVVVLMSASAHVTQNIAAMPFLWTLPLSLYLVTLILCFEGSGWYRRRVFLPLQVVALFVLMAFLSPGSESASLWIVLPVFATGMFVCCMSCHGELARARPAPGRLTSFYLRVALGGALGGAFAGLAAPRLFPGLWELPLSLVASAALALSAVRRRPPERLPKRSFWLGWSGAATLVVLAAAGFTLQAWNTWDSRVFMGRDFYGPVAVIDRAMPALNDTVRILQHGTIDHGEQYRSPAARRTPTTYYTPDSGGALAITRSPRPSPQRVGIVGLGSGNLAAFGRTGDSYRFYEISPLVTHVARSCFTFLDDSPAVIEVVPGDARLSLEREPEAGFHVLLVDAFSSDSIPTHLLTVEAFAVYRRHLAPGGVLALHITNKYLDLAPVVARGAAHHGLRAVLVEARKGDRWKNVPSSWVIVGEWPGEASAARAFGAGTDLVSEPESRAWTDDRTDLLRTLRR